MYKIIDKRGTGKTLQLMLLAKENDATIYCQNPMALSEKALRYGIVGINFLSYKDFLIEGQPKNTPYLIDNIDDFVKTLGPGLLGFNLSIGD